MQASARPTTLIDAVIPGSGILRDAALVIGFTLLVTVSAQISIRLPFTEVPITGQTLGALLTGGALGAKRGASSLALYLLLGTLGMPVFTPDLEGSGFHFVFPWLGTGAPVWTLVSGGYIVGFIAAAYVVGRLAELGWDRRWYAALAMVAGNMLIYVPGLLWLGYSLGSYDNVLVYGLYPFIIGDALKLAVAAGTLPGAWALVGRKRG